jgi:hypothetical protein
MLPLVYMAAPVGAPTPAEVDANVARAVRWFSFLLDAEPDVAIIAPWLAALLGRVQHDHDPAHRARGLRDNIAAARRCDGIALVGGRISSGMGDELNAVRVERGWVCDLTDYGPEPPVSLFYKPGEILADGLARWAQRGRAAWEARR